MANLSDESASGHSLSNENERTVVFRCSGQLFRLSMKELDKIPYLQALHANANFFKEKPDNNEEIVLSDSICDAGLLRAIVKYIQTGKLRSLFSEISASSTEAWKIFEFADFLLIEKPPSQGLRFCHLYDCLTTYKLTQHGFSRDVCVKLCWRLMDPKDLEMKDEEKSKLFDMVLYVVSHIHIFNPRLRQVTLEWYLHYFEPTLKQRVALLKWSN